MPDAHSAAASPLPRRLRRTVRREVSTNWTCVHSGRSAGKSISPLWAQRSETSTGDRYVIERRRACPQTVQRRFGSLAIDGASVRRGVTVFADRSRIARMPGHEGLCRCTFTSARHGSRSRCEGTRASWTLAPGRCCRPVTGQAGALRTPGAGGSKRRKLALCVCGATVRWSRSSVGERPIRQRAGWSRKATHPGVDSIWISARLPTVGGPWSADRR